MDTPLPIDDRPPRPTRRPSRGLLWAMALATVVLAIATIVAFAADDDETSVTKLDQDATPPPGLQPEDVAGQPVPAVEFERFDGSTGSFSDYEGRPLVVNFFASWCTPCVDEMPDFEQVFQQNDGRVAFLGLNVTEQPESARELIERTGITYDTARDPQGLLLRAFGGVNMPTTAFVSADGTIVKVHAGKLDQPELERIIADELS
jgi:cytochrome c biogenesis protein CcmG, thiol:disulfide interchange protein DsbE